MRRGYESVNISRAATLTNLFYLFFHGGKSALIPFFTLFFRLIGLTAFEAGCIIAAKTITSLIWAPLWARCASAYNRQRVVLMFSLFMMIVTSLVFPALYTQLARPEHCDGSPLIDNSSSSLSLNNSPASTSQPDIITPPSVSKNTTPSPPRRTSASTKLTTTKPPLTTSNPRTPAAKSDEERTEEPSASTLSLDAAYDEVVEILAGFGLTPHQILADNMTAHQIHEVMMEKEPDLNISENLIDSFLVLLKEKGESNTNPEVTESHNDGKHESKHGGKHHRHRRSSEWMVGKIRSKLVSIQTTLQSDKTLLCLVILAIVIAGEIFASPVEKVADDSWFDFLNRIDDLERYGQQRFWGSLAFVLVPIVVTVAVDNTPCFLPFHLHHYLLHFYIFAVLMAVALLIACCYPIPPPATSKYASKVGKAMRAVCCDGRGFLFTITLLLAGTVYASYHNFMFWRIQDLGGHESTMGLCVSAAAFAEIPMLIFSSRLVKRIGNCWTVSLALFILSLRVASYSAIPYPWAFVPIEFCHGITHTALWLAVLSYDDFNVGASVDRSIRSILSSFYFGVGFSAGSVVSGYLYHEYGAQTLFWAASAVTGGWMLLFSLIQKCLPQKEKVRYIKLLRSESDNSDDDEDDWLEMALKEK